MRPPVTTVERHAHLAAAAYMMRHAGDTAVVVTTDDDSRRPVGIIIETDIIHAVADGRDLNDTRIDDIIGLDPMTVEPDTSVKDAAKRMLSAHIRHLPVVEAGRLVGIIDITDACRALLDAVPVAPGSPATR
jgi:CBS domain-containing protein